MRHRIAIITASAVLALAAPAALPSASGPASTLLGAPQNAQAAVTKSLSGGEGGGGGNVSGAGSRLSDLLSGWAVPVLIVLAGCLLIGTLTARNIGASVGIVVITLIGLIFLTSPQSIESLAKNVANVVF